jgi:hypothetical protein
MNAYKYLNENIRIGRTIRDWRAIGIDCKIVRKQKRLSSGATRNASAVELNGEIMTVRAFAKRFPYAANPSV